MIYTYSCDNPKCEDHEKAVDVMKPMMESDRVEKCEKCKENMKRVYNLSGHATFSDGYKG